MTISYRLVRPEVSPDVALTPAQERVASHRQGALLVLGGPRTGKTTALMEAAVSGLKAGVPQVLFLTGSRQARLDLRARLGAASPEFAPRLRVTTFYSFCQWVVQRFGDQSQVPSVLSAARQDTYVRQILAGQPDDAWPSQFAAARTTREFAANVREAIAGCQRGGLDPADVRQRGVEQGREDWVGLARFYQEYLDILGMASVLDYPEFLIRAGRLLRDDQVLAAVRPAGSLIVVDQGEDLDSAQEEIVMSLVDQGTPVIVAANPDCQVYGFRGAKPRSAGEMLQHWGALGMSTQVVCLEQGYGVARDIEEGCGEVKRRIPLPAGVDVEDLNAYRRLIPDGEGEVAKIVFTDAEAEGDHIARILKRAHVADHVAYEDMAVLVRTRGDFSRYRLACEAAGVPVVVSGDEIQLNQERIVGTLLAALRVVRDGPECSVLDLRSIADSPLGAGDHSGGSGEEQGQGKLHTVLRAGADAMKGSVEEVLWAIWEASSWQEDLMAQIEQTGVEQLRANRALDAVVALFSLASRFSDIPADKGISALNEAVSSLEVPENLPRSSTWAASAVRLTTAHRAKGQHWSVVVVARIEEGVWPLRSTPGEILSVEGLSAQFSSPDDREVLAAERRLLYTACSSCSGRLILTAVDDEDRSPSLFFEQITGEVRRVGADLRTFPLSAPALVGELRTVVADETAHPGLRQAASVRLARLCADPLFYGAHPTRWWSLGLAPAPDSTPGTQITLSASQVEALLSCPRQWYLSRKAQASRPPTARTQIGSIIHGLVQDPTVSLEQMTRGLDQAWEGLDFPAAWMKDTELEEATKALERFDAYRRATGREVLASEVSVEIEVDSSGPVKIQGRIDRVERDSHGRVWIVDLKTGKTPPTKAEAGANIQLGLYQLALGMNAVPGVLDPVLGGAELVYLRADEKKGSQLPKTLAQESLAASPHLAAEPKVPLLKGELASQVGDQWQYPTWVHHRIALAAAQLRCGNYPAVFGNGCRYCAFRHGCPVISAPGESGGGND